MQNCIIQQFRLLVLHTAWKIDKYNDYKKVRKDIALVLSGGRSARSRSRRPPALSQPR